jgi:galactokinase/mevalonate kinase-like predicted kinase
MSISKKSIDNIYKVAQVGFASGAAISATSSGALIYLDENEKVKSVARKGLGLGILTMLASMGTAVFGVFVSI